MNDLVSIIVAVYNVENDLEQCIGSICTQSYKNLQIILIDDGSTDHSPQICDSWAKKDSRITVKHLENGGVSRARNEGILCARGTYIAFVDSDDWIEKDYIDTLVRNHKNGTLTCCGYIIERVKRKKKTKYCCVRYSGKNVYRDNYSKLIRRKELPALIQDMTGLNQCISLVRWQLICHKLFPVEFYLKTLVKKLLGVE